MDQGKLWKKISIVSFQSIKLKIDEKNYKWKKSQWGSKSRFKQNKNTPCLQQGKVIYSLFVNIWF
jgi:hypothetical protein